MIFKEFEAEIFDVKEVPTKVKEIIAYQVNQAKSNETPVFDLAHKTTKRRYVAMPTVRVGSNSSFTWTDLHRAKAVELVQTEVSSRTDDNAETKRQCKESLLKKVVKRNKEDYRAALANSGLIVKQLDLSSPEALRNRLP